MTEPTTLISIHRYPVKSMIGETLESASITDRGIAGDRVFAVRDDKRGGIRGAKKIPQLMTFAASTEDAVRPQARISAPDGETLLTSDPDISSWLSKCLGHPVTLFPLLPADQLEHYRRGAPDHEDFEQELQAVFGRTDGEPLPDLNLFAHVLEFESPPGTYFDAYPIHLLSRQSLNTLSGLAPDQAFDVRRFRPNLLVDFPESREPFPENALTGQHMTIGDVVLEIVGPCPRCSMTTHGFADLERDTGIMRSLVTHAEGNLGVYARVVNKGTVAVGDILSQS